MSELRETVSPNIPQLDMSSILKGAIDFASAKAAIVESIKNLKSIGFTRIGFVSGPIGKTSSFVDDEKGTAMNKSMDAMQKVEEEMIAKHQISIFSSTDIFRTKWEQLTEGLQIQQGILVGEEKEIVMNNLFGGILEEGGITDIFMMKGWKNAPGSIYEYNVMNAMKTKNPDINIHDLDLQK